MRHVVRISLSLFLVLFVAGMASAQYQAARIIVKGVSPDVMVAGRYNSLSTGLPNVGKGQKVWLEARVLAGATYSASHLDTITAQTWTVTGPPGSLVTGIVHTDTTTYFVPDTTGTFHVTLEATTNNGTVTASMDINSALWVGIGNILSGDPDPGAGECAGCHAEKAGDWKGTGHSRIFAFNVDSSDHYSASCISCHTVGFDKAATAVNGGWDDVALSLGFTVPSPQHPGIWDSIKTNFPALAQKSNIQCENCHGPGSLHMGDVSNNKIAVSLSADVCNVCHGRAMHHIKSYEWNNSVHSRTLGEPGEDEHMNGSSCARCHTANGYLAETVNGKAPAAPYDDPQPVTCAACHDPHNASHPGQLRAASVGSACDGCHITRISSRGLHHAHQSPMLNGSTGTPFSGQTGVGAWGGWQLPGYDYPNSSHTAIADRCPTCHMATVDETLLADTAMVPFPYSQWEGKLGGHTFRVAWDHDTPDNEADDVVNPFGCKDCHGTVTIDFVRLTQAKTRALLEELGALLPHNTTGDTTLPKAHTAAGLTKAQQVAAYNYYFVANDGSFGVHNFNYVKALLEASIDQVKLGAAAAGIAQIRDVPNDQGKQVQVVWNQFPGELYGVNPVIRYVVMRQDPILGASSSQNLPVAKSLREMISLSARSPKVLLGGSVWTQVGEQYPMKLAQYSLIAPTLVDSTISGGMQRTVFYVCGMTADPNTLYASSPDSGYSVDNLAPLPPAGVVAQSGIGVALLSWNAPSETDVKGIAVYRGTTPGFVPSGEPIAMTGGTAYADADVQSGTTYYYKLAAVDFAGNVSGYSTEVSLLVTGVGQQSGIPTEYALGQNYPNPFNPSTLIRYQVPEAARVRIAIYNPLGMLVATLVDEVKEPGYHSIQWDGRDNRGNAMVSGIYIYRMDAGLYNSVRKMLLLK